MPLSVDLSCFVAERMEDLLEQPLGGSLYELVRVRYGLAPAVTTETIEVVSASPREAHWLDIAQTFAGLPGTDPRPLSERGSRGEGA